MRLPSQHYLCTLIRRTRFCIMFSDYFPPDAACLGTGISAPFLFADTNRSRDYKVKNARLTPALPESRLPDFSSPPAVETYLGLHFSSLKNWKAPHFGLFWQVIKKEYPHAEVLPPVASQNSFQIELNIQRTSLKASGEIPVSWWYFHKAGTRLIQIQNDRFVQNWRKRGSHDRYIHYAKLKPSFMEMWGRFLRFLKTSDVAAPEINLCETTYVNNIERGVAWRNFADLSKVVSGWSGKLTTGFLPDPGLLTLSAVYPMPKGAGSLRISMQPGLRKADNVEVIELTLTASCRPASSQANDLSKAFDLGREWIVRGFEDFTTKEMHTFWGKKKRK
jgi:uncharacterized protein (TIGR04255 family)